MEKSPLNRLPAELRLDIFEYVFTFDSLAWERRSWRITPKGERTYRPLSKVLGATLVCKQMRKETLHLPLLLNNPVFGQEVGDFDPYYEWWIAPPLKDPCTWAFDALSKITHVIPDSTTIKLHLWAYPAMVETRVMSDSQLSVLGPAKLIVVLHFQFNYDNLQCGYLGFDHLIEHGETIFEVRQGIATAAQRGIALLGATMENKRKELQRHENHHEDDLCRINYHLNRLSTQLTQAEQVSLRFLDLATRASIPGNTLLTMSEDFADSASPGQQELRRDSTRPTRGKEEHLVT
jgi:hypothetical protein